MKLSQLTDGTVQYRKKKKPKKFESSFKTEAESAADSASDLQTQPRDWERSDLRAPTPMKPR